MTSVVMKTFRTVKKSVNFLDVAAKKRGLAHLDSVQNTLTIQGIYATHIAAPMACLIPNSDTTGIDGTEVPYVTEAWDLGLPVGAARLVAN